MVTEERLQMIEARLKTLEGQVKQATLVIQNQAKFNKKLQDLLEKMFKPGSRVTFKDEMKVQ